MLPQPYLLRNCKKQVNNKSAFALTFRTRVQSELYGHFDSLLSSKSHLSTFFNILEDLSMNLLHPIDAPPLIKVSEVVQKLTPHRHLACREHKGRKDKNNP